MLIILIENQHILSIFNTVFADQYQVYWIYFITDHLLTNYETRTVGNI